MKFEMTFYFGILSSFFFFPIARNFLNVKLKCRCFSRLCLYTDLLTTSITSRHSLWITDINSDSRRWKNWWVSEKRNAVTLGWAGCIDDEVLVVYNSITASQQAPVCLAENWLISQISSTPWPCTFPNIALLIII